MPNIRIRTAGKYETPQYFHFWYKIQLDLPVHDAVEDVAERALGLVALDEGDLDPRA